MAWPESLTTDQQAAVEQFCNNLRSWAILVWQANNLGLAIAADWSGSIQALVNTLQSTDLVPNTSGLAGAQPLLPADITSLESWANAMSNPSNPTQGTGGFSSLGIQQLLAKAAGINALVSG